jgi:hypothetical protein
MTWRWDQSAGELSHDGVVSGRGYSGRDLGRNNTAMQAAVGVGPIPAGQWRILRLYDSDAVGPSALELQPEPGTQTFGRSAFRIHGDSIAHPGAASHGCIILPRAVRQRIWDSGDRALEVVE